MGEGTIHEHLQPYTHTQQKTFADIYRHTHSQIYSFLPPWKEILWVLIALEVARICTPSQCLGLVYIHSCKTCTHTKNRELTCRDPPLCPPALKILLLYSLC